jgi:Ca-activated chloride channel family protein
VGFGIPSFLLLVLIVPLLAVLQVWAARRRRQTLRTYAGSGLSLLRSGADSPGRGRLKTGLRLGGVLLVTVAVSLPELGHQKLVLPRAGSDVVIAMDVSRSMNVGDVRPTRLDQAKRAADSLIDHLNGDRVALVVFAGSAVDRFPLTTDPDAAKQVVDSLAILDGGVRGGTDLASAFDTASTILKADASYGRVIVVVSDGEDLAGSDLQAADRAASSGITVETVGVGTAAGGPVFATNPVSGKTTPVIDPDTGEQAISHRDDTHLRQLAGAGKGAAFDGNTTAFAFDLSGAIDRLQPTRFDSGQATIPYEYFQLPLALGLILLVFDTLLVDGRRPPGLRQDREATETRTPSGDRYRRAG